MQSIFLESPHTGRPGRILNQIVRHERGAALITALMLLLIMTLLSITAITTSTLQEKMAGNMRDQYMAQQAGDSILRDGESWIFRRAFKPVPSCTPDTNERVWDSSCTDIRNVATQPDSWWSTNGFTANSSVAISDVSQEPRYVDEFVQRVPACLDCSPKIYRFYYRTSSWSVGASDYARGLFQSTFSRRSDEFQN